MDLVGHAAAAAAATTTMTTVVGASHAGKATKGKHTAPGGLIKLDNSQFNARETHLQIFPRFQTECCRVSYILLNK